MAGHVKGVGVNREGKHSQEAQCLGNAWIGVQEEEDASKALL